MPGIVDLEDMDEESQEEFIHQVYRFFIVNISQNMFNYVYRYIDILYTYILFVIEVIAYLIYCKMVSNYKCRYKICFLIG